MEAQWFDVGYQQEESWWVRRFEGRNNQRTLRRLARAGVRRGQLLEVGIGSGSFLAAARDAGFNVLGCDLSPALVERARSRYGLALHVGSLDSISGESCFDAIVMNHVLEHTPEPIEFLRAARRLVKPDGVIHVAVPNLECWEARLSGWNSYEPYHLVYFTQRTLCAVGRSAGLEVRWLGTHESFSGWFLAVLRSLVGIGRNGAVERSSTKLGAVPARRAAPVEHGYRLAMAIAGTLSWPIRLLQAAIGHGDELLMIARRAREAAR